MPTLKRSLSAPQGPARLAALAEALTVITVATLGKRAEVTAGTNNTGQKAAFITAAFTEPQHQLATGRQLEAASYVAVHELSATDWGHGGQTQRARQVAREQAAQAQAA